MVRVEWNRQDAESVWNLLMAHSRELTMADGVSSREDLARAIAQACGFSHEAARERTDAVRTRDLSRALAAFNDWKYENPPGE